MTGAPAPGAAGRPRHRRWWALGLIVPGVLWMLLCACLYATGYSTAVTVTGSTGDGFCGATWEDPAGHLRTGEVECGGQALGDRVDVRVTGWPGAGEPTLPETYVGMGLVLGLPPVAFGAVLLRRRRGPRGTAVPPGPGTPPAPAGGRDAAVSVDRTAAALARDARRTWGLVAAGVAGASAVLLIGVLSFRTDDRLRGVGVTTVGTVLSLDADTRLGEGGASVRFPVRGDTRDRYVFLGGYADDYVEGQTVDVVYDPSDPDRFTIDDVPYEPDWAVWTLPVAVAVGTGFGTVGIRRSSATRRIRRLLATRAWDPVRVRVLWEEDGYSFTTDPGAVWRSVAGGDWPEPNREPRELSGWGLPDEDPAGVPPDQPAWWVSDGRHAVFSPDRGAPLVLARRGPAG